MAEKERKRTDDLPAGAVEQVRELLHRPRSSADFSPAARYAVSKLCDYAAQEHEQREKAETRSTSGARRWRFPPKWRGRRERLTICASSYRSCARHCARRGRE